MKKRNKINTGKSKIGAFTRAAKKAGMPEQEFAKKVLNNKYDYSPEIIKKANFISTVAKWEKKKGGLVKYQKGKLINVPPGSFSKSEDQNFPIPSWVNWGVPSKPGNYKRNFSDKSGYLLPSISDLILDPNWKNNLIPSITQRQKSVHPKLKGRANPSKLANLQLKPKKSLPGKFNPKFKLNTPEDKINHPIWGKYKKVSKPSGFNASFSYDPNDALSITGKIDPKLKNKEINPSIQLKGKYKNILDVGYDTDFENSNLNLGLNNKYVSAKFNTDFEGANKLALKAKYKDLFGADFDTNFKENYNIGVKAGPFSGRFSNTDNIKNLDLSLKHKNIGLKVNTDLQGKEKFNITGKKEIGPVKVAANYNINRDKDKLYHNLGIEGDIKFSPKFSLSPSLVSDITNQKNKLGLSAKISPNKKFTLTPKVSWSPDQYSVGTGMNWKPNKMLNIGANVNYGNEGFGGNVSLKTALNNTKKELPKHQDGKNIKKRILKEYPGFENILNKTKYYKTDILDSGKTGFGDTETIFPNIDTIKYINYINKKYLKKYPDYIKKYPNYKTDLKDLENPNYNTDNYTVAYNPENINLKESTIPLASELFHISNLDPVLKSLRKDIVNTGYERDPYFKKDVSKRIKEYPEYTKKEQEEIVADGYMRNILYNSLLENTGKDYILKNNRYHPEEAKDISGFYQPMSNQIINYLQNPQGYPLPQVNVTAKRINKQKGGLVKYQKGKNIGGVERYNSILNKFDNKRWSSLSKDEQQFYKDNYKTIVPNRFTLDENNTLYGTLPTVHVTTPYYKGKGEDITREGVTDAIVSGGKALAKELYDYSGVPALKRVAKDPGYYYDQMNKALRDVVTLSPVPTANYSDLMDLVDVAPGVGLVGTGAKKAGKALTKGPLKNAYKLNPRALKENPEEYLYRAQEIGQNPYKNMAAQLREKQAAGEKLKWFTNEILNPTNPEMIAREKYYGQWFENDPSRLGYYLSSDKIDEAAEILRIKLPKSQTSKFNVSNFDDANMMSLSPETEFVLPKQMVGTTEKFSPSSLQQLIEQNKAFNTPHWLKGYKKAKLVDNTLDFANAAKGGLGAMPGTFTRSGNSPGNVIVANQLNKNLSDFSKETIKEVKPNANRFENIIYTNPISQQNARNLVEQGKINEIYNSFKEGANTIDEFKKNYLKDLTSNEGIKRLINQEADYLRSIGIPESEITKRAETAAFARINEIKDIKNLNRKFSQGKSELSSIIDNSSNFNNAYYRSANKQEILDDVLSDDLVNNTRGISLKKNKRIGEKSYPGSTALGTTYSKNIPTASHEIVGHGLQANRKLPLDDRLRKLDVDSNTLNEYELAAYNYYKKGSKGKEPSAFLHGLREAMLQAGLIKSRYEYISPKKIKMAKTYFDRRPSGVVNDNDFSFHSNTRILDFAKPTESNFKLLAEEINKLPLTIPAIGTAGLLNQQQYKQGGQVKKDLKGTYTSSAQRLMDDNDLDPSYITASNENGRIYKGDVSKALKSLNNYGAGFPNALDYKKVGVLPKNKIKYSKNTLIGPVGMPPYRWKSYKTPLFNDGGQIPHQGTKVSMKMLDENDMLPPNDSDRLSYRNKPVGMSLTMSKTIKSPMQVIQYDDGGNIARTEDEFEEGLNAGKNVFPFGQKGLKKMTSTPPSGDMEVPINMKGFTDGEQTDEQVMLPGEDVNIDGDTVVETPDLSSMDLNKAFDYANSKKFPIFMWKGNEYKLKRHLKKKQRGGLFSNKVTDHVKLNPGFSPDVK